MSEVKEAWIKRVLGVDVGSQSTDGQAPDMTAELTARLQTIREDILALGGAAKDLVGNLRTAAEAVKARDPDAPAMVDSLEGDIARLRAQQRVAGAAGEIARGNIGKASVVAFGRAKMRWDAARNGFQAAGANLESAVRTLLETDAFLKDGRSHKPETQQKLATLPERLPNLEKIAGSIDVALMAIRDGSAANGQADRMADAVKAIDNYLAELNAIPMLKALQASEAGGLPIVDAISTALGELRGQLAV